MTRFDNLIFFAPIDAYRFQSANHPGGIILGTEATFKGRYKKKFFAHASHRFQYSLSDREPHRALPYRPAHLARIKLGQRIGQFTLQVLGTHVGEQTIDVYGLRTLQDYRELDASVDVKVRKNARITVSGTNLLNGLTHRDFPTMPRPGRTFLLLISASSL